MSRQTLLGEIVGAGVVIDVCVKAGVQRRAVNDGARSRCLNQTAAAAQQSTHETGARQPASIATDKWVTYWVVVASLSQRPSATLIEMT